MLLLFTILVLFFLYREGESLAQAVRRALRERIGERAEGYADVATRALRASVSSMLVVGLFDGFACFFAFALAGAQHAALWAAITGALALVPFLGYAAVAALVINLPWRALPRRRFSRWRWDFSSCFAATRSCAP